MHRLLALCARVPLPFVLGCAVLEFVADDEGLAALLDTSKAMQQSVHASLAVLPRLAIDNRDSAPRLLTAAARFCRSLRHFAARMPRKMPPQSRAAVAQVIKNCAATLQEFTVRALCRELI